MKNTTKLLTKILAVLLIATTCIALPTALPEEAAFSSVASAATIALNKGSATIYAGKTVQLNLTGTKKTPTWSSSNTKVAKVSSTGKVKGVKAGTATITAKLGSKKYTCTVKVKSPLSVETNSVTFTSQTAKTVNITYKLTSGNVSVEVADKSIASCSLGKRDGNTIPLKIKAKKYGTTTITVSNNKTKDVKKITVTVKKITGDVQWLLGKKYSYIKNRVSGALTPFADGYKNDCLGLQVNGSKITRVMVADGPKYQLFGIYPGMNYKTAFDKLTNLDWDFADMSDNGIGTFTYWYFTKGSREVMVSVYVKTRCVWGVALY